MSSENSKNTRVRYADLFALSLVVLIVIGLIGVFSGVFGNHEERTTSEESRASISSLSCSAKDLAESFFGIADAVSNKQEIKVAFKDDKIYTIMYTLDVTYGGFDIARIQEASLHGDYDKYMTGHGLSPESISNDFALVNDVVKIKLYSEKKGLNSMTASMFLLDPANYSYSSKGLKDYYEKKGFSCHYKE